MDEYYFKGRNILYGIMVAIVVLQLCSDYIDKTPPSNLRNEIEITDVIQNMIDNKEQIKPVFFKGNYLNVTFPEDLKNWK